ncbi:MAG: polysaccharide deacetylase [Blautia sp.]|nr:polysaccharide deacetylase [Blautia sp.]
MKTEERPESKMQMSAEDKERLRRRRARLARKKRRERIRRIKIFAVMLLCAAAVLFASLKTVSSVIKKRDLKMRQEEERILQQKEANQKAADILKQAKVLAQQYDYEGAIALLSSQSVSSSNEEIQSAINGYKKEMESLTEVNLDEVTHIFYHSLVVDPKRGFSGTQGGQFNMWMTTVSEFNRINQSLYEKGYVLIRLRDMVKETRDKDGNVTFEKAKIMLPAGKKPLILSLDDLSYYHGYDGYGMASKLVLDKDGNPTCEYVDENGKTLTGSYDCVPLLDDFVEEHPDFSYKGAKGVIALTGYNGILGYRTDQSYQDRPDDLDYDKVAWLDKHPDFNLEQERESAKKVADAMKEKGWEFASHTWGHQYIAEISMDKLKADTEKWMANVAPLVGGTDTIIFAHGQDIVQGGEYPADNEKYQYLKQQGFNYFCSVDGSKYTTQITENYVRQGRRNLDGYRMYHNPEMLSDLFDAKEVFDKERPTPVPAV